MKSRVELRTISPTEAARSVPKRGQSASQKELALRLVHLRSPPLSQDYAIGGVRVL